MRILITNTALYEPGGTEGIVCDLAKAWHRRGDQAMVFSPRLGPVAAELKREGVEVTDSLERLSAVPDLIHGQHRMETLMAVRYFPNTPALFHCHGWEPWQERPPVHPRILLYLAIGDRTRDFVHKETGTPATDIRVVPNHFDARRFPLARNPSPRLQRALIYNRYLRPEETETIVSACAEAGIACDPFAALNPPVSHPESVLPGYDLVFAVGKSAIEAAAVGAAVFICTENAIGRLVTGDNVASWRHRNFTAAYDRIPVTRGHIAQELALYSADATARATAFVREHASFERYLALVDEAHTELLRRARNAAQPDPGVVQQAEFRHDFDAGNLLHHFSGEAYVQRRRAEELDRAFVQQRDALSRVTVERDIAIAQRQAMAGTLVWRLRERLLGIPLVGAALNRIGKRLGKGQDARATPTA